MSSLSYFHKFGRSLIFAVLYLSVGNRLDLKFDLTCAPHLVNHMEMTFKVKDQDNNNNNNNNNNIYCLGK